MPTRVVARPAGNPAAIRAVLAANADVAVLRYDLTSATLVRKSAGSVDRVEGVAQVVGERAGGGDDVRAGPDLDGAVAACGLDAGTLVLPSGVAARGHGQPADTAAVQLARRPQPVSDAEVTTLAVTYTPASAATLCSLNART